MTLERLAAQFFEPPRASSSACPPGTVDLTSRSTASRRCITERNDEQRQNYRRNACFQSFRSPPKDRSVDNYLGNAKMLRPELELVDGFVDNIRYKSLTRDGWILSLSGWRDEKSVVRWNAIMRFKKNVAPRFCRITIFASVKSRATPRCRAARRSQSSVSTKPRLARERRSPSLTPNGRTSHAKHRMRLVSRIIAASGPTLRD